MKTVFSNKTFFYLLISFISLLLLWNIYTLVIGNIWSIIPISVQVILLILILSENQYAKKAILIWVIIFLIVAPLLKLIAIILGLINDAIDKTKYEVNIRSLIYTVISLAIGILILDYTKRSVKVERPVTEKLEELQS